MTYPSIETVIRYWDEFWGYNGERKDPIKITESVSVNQKYADTYKHELENIKKSIQEKKKK
jgi:hypothetical protein